MELNEVRKKLEQALGDDLQKQYKAYLREWILFNPKITKDEFDTKVRSLFQSEDQIKCHNDFMFALFTKISSSNKSKLTKSTNNKGVFEPADYPDYLQPKDPNRPLPSTYSYPRAAVELFTPYSGFMACRINIVAWEYGMEGANSEVTPLMVHACQTFLKNIITAMVSRMKGFKLRDNKFQYGFNMPIPDPFIRNSNNVIDDTADCGTLDEERLLPKCKMSLERTQYERAIGYAASKKRRVGVVLGTKLLYETIRNNPSLFGQHGIHSVQTLKLSLHDDLYESFSEDESE